MSEFFREVDVRRAHAAAKLKNKELEEKLFHKHFPFTASLTNPNNKTRKQIAEITAQLQNAKRWYAYNMHVRSLVKNFQQNRALIHKPVDWLIAAKPWDLQPQVWAPYQKEVYDWQQEEEKDEYEEVAEEGSFKCNKCGSYKVTYTQLQTRSADEGMTSLFHCLNCNKRWKVY